MLILLDSYVASINTLLKSCILTCYNYRCPIAIIINSCHVLVSLNNQLELDPFIIHIFLFSYLGDRFKFSIFLSLNLLPFTFLKPFLLCEQLHLSLLYCDAHSLRFYEEMD